MVTFIKISKEGNLSEEKVDNMDNLYKKCGLRKPEGFSNLYKYESSQGNIELWGRNNGRANTKNSYILPFKKDILIYGTAALVLKNNDSFVDITIDIFNNLINIKKEEENKLESNKEPINKLDNDSDNDSENDSDNNSEISSDDDSNISEFDSELKVENYIYSSEEEQ